MRFRVVGLSIPTVPTLCLKEQLIGDDIINLELLLTVWVVRWRKLPGCWQLKDKINSPLAIKNYLLKHNDVTIIYAILRENFSLLLRLRDRHLSIWPV